MQANVDFMPAEEVVRVGRTRSPFELGLGWLVDFKKPLFNGRSALLKEQEKGSRYRFAMLDVEGNKPAEHSFILKGDKQVGTNTSRSLVPHGQANIAYAQIEMPHGAVGDELVAEIYYQRELHWTAYWRSCKVISADFKSLGATNPQYRHIDSLFLRDTPCTHCHPVDDSFQRMRQVGGGKVHPHHAMDPYFYRSHLVHEQELEHLIFKSWIYALHASRFPLQVTISSSKLARTRSLWRAPKRALSRLRTIFVDTAAPAFAKRRAAIAEHTFVPTTAVYNIDGSLKAARETIRQRLTLMQQLMA